ncbi:MAG: ATP-dependent helicase [archaeon]
MGIEWQKEMHSDEEIFKSLHPLLAAWFKWRFRSFTEPQRYAILNIHGLQNTLVSAPTGTGKTLSAFTAVLNELISLSDQGKLEDKIYCLYISPLRALSNDIERNLNQPLGEIKKAGAKIGKDIDFRVAVRTGDTTASERSKQARKPPHILITTPESFAILLNSPKFMERMKEIKWVVVDEIHSLAENKRGVHLSLSLERLQRQNPTVCRIGLSATIAPLEEMAKFLVGMKNEKEARDCRIVDVQSIKKLDLQVVSPLPDLINVSAGEIQGKLYETLHRMIQQHKTTLVFTNTRSATERVVHNLKEKFPTFYHEGNLDAHHSSVSREKRLNVETRLKEGKLKCVVSSTSLELGIDIGFIDLVVLLGSPKSISRALQRIGRSGHRLHDTVKGRIIVLDRDDLVECAVLLKNALEHRLDRVKIPHNCLDVLAQQVFGIAIAERILEKDLFSLVRGSYCFSSLSKQDFDEVIKYLSGYYSTLETRHVYAKIWLDEETGMIGRRGKMARVLYMTNVGTIPDEARITVKMGEHSIGTIDESFLERMRPGDVFVLAGQSYAFRYSRGNTIQVSAALKRPPTIPSWVSEMLPLSFDLALEIQKFRLLMAEKFEAKRSKAEVLDFLKKYLYLEGNAANAIYNYFRDQFLFAGIPDEKRLLIEYYTGDDGKRFAIIHTLYGRRVNDALSRVLAYLMGRLVHKDVEITMNDNGFMLSCEKMPVRQAFLLLERNSLREIAGLAVEKTQVLERRFRHCAARALMILRNYRGKTKSVGRQQMSSRLLLIAVKQISNDFPILKEARREVLEDMMDISAAEQVVEWIHSGKLKVIEKTVETPSPFAFNLFAWGQADVLKMEGKLEFIKRMHEKVKQKIREKEKS